ncbi:hypothetical protein F5Y16DRAFT_145255 [Xylariaceae sp. FL0255]|nr:hypothetical protein F5Y16DRAFT_145255 [Xylariaceae sp. FL0255]
MVTLCLARVAVRRQQPLAQSCRVFTRTKTKLSVRKQFDISKWKVPKTPARTRFAPSPTGYLHLGSLRTALYNYLLAKASGGQFLLRVEDTDQKRLVPDAEERLYEDLNYYGLTWDEGPDIGGSFGPYRQSERLDIYKDHANQLLERGDAYRCFCTPEELDEMKRLAMEKSQPPIYNKKCSHISAEESADRAAKGEAHCIRLKCDPKAPQVQDLVYGPYTTPPSEPLEHFIIIKRDGFPTYHFANVIDDHKMEITHVIRGAEWLISTPRHVALYNAFNWKPPIFAHVGLLVDENRQKLSKRSGDLSLDAWKAKGTLPPALLNYVLLLGWALKRQDTSKENTRKTQANNEVLDMSDMIRNFHLKFTKGNIMLNNKSDFLQKAHMVRAIRGDTWPDTVGRILPQLSAAIGDYEQQRRARLEVDQEDPELGVRLGELVPIIRDAKMAKPAETDEQDLPRPVVMPTRYFLGLLDAMPGIYTTPTDFIRKNIYSIWSVPVCEHALQLRNHRSEFSNLVSGTMHPQPSKLSELALHMKGMLGEVLTKYWDSKRLDRTCLSLFVKGIRDGKPRKDREGVTDVPGDPRGWQVLRWILCASAPGSGLQAMMVALGKEETMRRFDQAISVARAQGM